MLKFIQARRVALAAMALAAAAAPAHAGQYRVEVSGTVILPPEETHAPGLERAVVPGDILMRAPLGWADAATIRQDVSLEIAGLRETISSDSVLFGVTSARGGDLAGLPEGRRIYCGEQRVNAVGAVMGVATFGLTNIGSRVARVRRFCLADLDSDGRFERAFLVGAKRAADQHMIEIAPVPYEAMRNHPIGPGNFVQVRYGAGGLLGNPLIFADYYFGNIPQPIDSLYTGEGRATIRTRAATAFRTTPRAFAIGPAQFTVLSFDRETKAARIRYERDFALTPVNVGFAAQTVYVVVPR
ncbi:MAG: hypothetical protein QOD42_3749 [Sphingomonadales bacterium]|jgi:hypothetical protein|nr:hypothetical protein [Sphingomonadales bacterium]